jgi:hypothetical protein
VATLYDKTGNGNNLTQATNANRATLVVPGNTASPNGATQNGQFYMSCGSGAFYSNANFHGKTAIAQPFTSYLFGRSAVTQAGNSDGVFVANNGGAPVGPSLDNLVRWDVYAGSNPYMPATPNPAWHNFAGVFNNTSSIGGIDGVQAASLSSGTGSFDSGGTVYLCQDGYGDQWQGNISELGIWPSGLTSTQLTNLNTNIQGFYNPQAFTRLGGSIPWDSSSRGAFLDTATNIAWLFTTGYVCQTGCTVPASSPTFYSVPLVYTYNLTTGQYGNNGQPYTLTASAAPNPNDYHNAPSCVETNESGTSYWYCFDNAHNSAAMWQGFAASSLGATIIASGTFGTNVTGQRPFWNSATSKIYLVYGTQGNGSNNQDAIFVQAFTYSAGTLTASGSPINIIDCATSGNTGWLAGASYSQVGANIYIATDYSLTLNGNWTAAYLFVYNMTTGAISNFQGTNTVPSGSLPIGPVSFFNSNGYQVYTGTNLGSTWQHVDSNGVDHFLIGDNSSGNGFLAYLENSGAGWSSATNLYSFTVSLGAYNAQAVGRTNSQGNEDVFFSDGNNMLKTTKISGSFTSPSTVLGQQGTYGLSFPQVVIGGTDAAAIMFTEGNATVAGGLRGYFYGINGFIANQAGL